MAVDRKVDNIGVLLGNHSKTISFQAMLADLVDNCIDAGASTAEIFFQTNDYVLPKSQSNVTKIKRNLPMETSRSKKRRRQAMNNKK